MESVQRRFAIPLRTYGWLFDASRGGGWIGAWGSHAHRLPAVDLRRPHRRRCTHAGHVAERPEHDGYRFDDGGGRRSQSGCVPPLASRSSIDASFVGGLKGPYTHYGPRFRRRPRIGRRPTHHAAHQRWIERGLHFRRAGRGSSPRADAGWAQVVRDAVRDGHVPDGRPDLHRRRRGAPSSAVLSSSRNEPAMSISSRGVPRWCGCGRLSAVTRPLEGIKVVDFAGHGFVPSAAAALADWGAEVVKIERPSGDPLRAVLRDGLVADADGTDYIWEFFNRNKRGIALDVETAAGREIFERLVKWADVYITNQLPRVRRKLRTEPADLLALNPQLVYAKGHGQGQRGPDAEAGGFDSVSFWSRGGVGHMLSSPDAELPVGQRAGQGDIPSGMFLAAGVCAALVGVSRTGEGVVVDTSLLGSAMWTLAPDLAYTSIAGHEPPRTRADPAARSPLVGQHQTADGRWLSLSMLDEDRYWAPTCRALGLQGLIEQFPDAATRNANRLHIYQQISASIAGGTHDDVDAALRAEGASSPSTRRRQRCSPTRRRPPMVTRCRIPSTPRCDSARPPPSSTTSSRSSAGLHRRSASTRVRSSPSSGTRPTRSRASSTTASSPPARASRRRRSRPAQRVTSPFDLLGSASFLVDDHERTASSDPEALRVPPPQAALDRERARSRHSGHLPPARRRRCSRTRHPSRSSLPTIVDPQADPALVQPHLAGIAAGPGRSRRSRSTRPTSRLPTSRT